MTDVHCAQIEAVIAIGAVYFAIAAAGAARLAMLVSLALCMLAIFASAALLSWMRRAAD